MRICTAINFNNKLERIDQNYNWSSIETVRNNSSHHFQARFCYVYFLFFIVYYVLWISYLTLVAEES